MGLKIAYVLPGTSISGGVKVALDHVTRLNRLPFLKTRAFALGPSPDWLEMSNVPLISADPLKVDFSDVDIIITTFFNQGSLYERWNHKLLIHFCQGYEGDYLKYLGKEFLRPEIEAFYHRAKVRFTVNRFLCQRIKEFPGEVYNIGQGLDCRCFNSEKRKEPEQERVLIVGQYDLSFKGVQTALILVQKLKEIRPELKVVRVDLNDTSAEEKKIFTADEYHWAVSTSQMAELYRSSTLTIFLPEKEGFGLPVIESLACGTPVVASDIPPLRETCGGDYPLVSPHNVSETAHFICSLLDDPIKLAALRNAGLRISKKFSYNKVLCRLVAILLWTWIRFPNGY